MEQPVEARPVMVIGLLWLVAGALRLTLLAVPPLLPAIHRSLALNEKLVGALNGLPILLFAVASIPGSFVIARLGARRALLVGLVLAGAGSALRGLGTSAAVLFVCTFVMAIGIALGQPTLPGLVRSWLPTRSGLATAAYSNGYLIGEILPVALTVPLVLRFVGGGWERAVLFWSMPVLGIASLVAWLGPRHEEHSVDDIARWWPDWHNTDTWVLGLTLGCGSIAYFGSNAFLPDYLKATHHAGLINAALVGVNVGQLPSSFLVAAFPHRLIARRWPVAGAGLVIVLSVGGYTWLPALSPVWGCLLGFSSALVFVLSLALPPLLSAPGDVHRLSAAMFALAYTCAAVGSFLGGALWDATRVAVTAFSPVLVGGCVMVALSTRIHAQAPGAARS